MYALLIIGFVVLSAFAYRLFETHKAHRELARAAQQTQMEKALEKYRDLDD